MALKTVTATFTGVEERIDVTWTGIGAAHHISIGVVPTDGFGAIKPWLTNHYANGATVNVDALWQGTVKLTVVDAPSLATWPASFQASDLVSAADNVHGLVGNPLATPLDNVIAMQVKPEITSVQVQYANRALMWPGNMASQPAASISGAKIAVGPIHTNGQSWTSTPTVHTGITLPSGGALYTDTAIDITGMRNANGEIGIAWSVPTGQAFYGEQPGYFGYGATNEDVSGLSSLTGPVNINPLFVNVVYTIPATYKRIIIIGDSLTRGLSSGFGDTNPTYKQTLGWLIGGRSTSVCCRAAGSGQTLFAWADSVGRPWLLDFEKWTGATALIILGTNDVNGGVRTGAQMLADLATLCTYLRNQGVFDIWVATVAPSSTYSSQQNTDRGTYNTGVRALPNGITYCLDVDAVLRNAGLPNQLQASYACGDLLHWTAAANTALFNQGISDGKW